jgi:hypothetical protein
MSEQPIDYQDELPLLTEVADEPESAELPMLTEIVAQPDAHPANRPNNPPRTLNPAELHQLQQQLEVHLETVFTGKLNSQLEQLQRLAVNLAISEFKAELPQLLRDALTKTDVSR